MAKLKKQEETEVNRLLGMSDGEFEEYIYNGNYCADDLKVLWKYSRMLRELVKEKEEDNESE